jgi:hypothetical protein
MDLTSLKNDNKTLPMCCWIWYQSGARAIPTKRLLSQYRKWYF